MSERINQHLHPLVGSNIRRLRKEQGLKATEVIAKLQCDGINVTTGIFSKVENGYNNPTVDMLIGLTKIFIVILMNSLNNNRQLNGEWFSCLLSVLSYKRGATNIIF